MRSIFSALLCAFAFTISAVGHASYDFTTEAETVSLKTRQGTAIPGAVYDYYVFAERLEVPCMDDLAITQLSCWKGITLQGGKLRTDASGVATLAPMHFASRSPWKRQGETRNLLVGFWGVLTPFQDAQGKDRSCVAIQGYTLQQAKIGWTADGRIDADDAELAKFVDEQVSLCKEQLATGRYADTEYVLPY